MAENEESHATWQSAGGNSLDPFEMNSVLPFQGNQQEDLRDTSGVRSGGDLDDWDMGSSGPMETVWRIGRQISPLLIPLLFAIITFIFVALLMPRQKGPLFSSTTISFALVLLVLAAVQGTLMYYGGSNDGLWSIYIVSGFCLFLLVGTFAIFGVLPSLLLLVVLVVVGIFFARRCVRTTPEGDVDIVQSFGKYTRTFTSGLNVLLPWEKVTRRLSIREQSWLSPLQRLTISQSQDVQFIASVAYQLQPEDAYIVALNLQDWEKSVQDRFIATTQSVINELSPEDFIAWQQGNRSRGVSGASVPDVAATTRWDRINARLMQRMQESVVEWGVQINWVGIRDLFLAPHVSTGASTAAPRTVSALSAQAIQQKMPTPAPAQSSPQAASASEAAPLPIQVDVLTDAYDAVRQGLITDPETIRSIARRFEVVASNPEETQKFGYDASRAAQNLYRKAQVIEGERGTEQVNYDADTQPDWPVRRSANNNLRTGG